MSDNPAVISGCVVMCIVMYALGVVIGIMMMRYHYRKRN